jgi:C_GCAxxG_C_C family probable redox protein
MLTIEDTIYKASKYASQGYLCSEAVFLAISDYLKIKNPLIPKIATGFGAGIGRTGEACGAFTGSIIGLGMMFGRNDPEEQSGQKPYWYSIEFQRRFKEKFEHIRCPDLLDLDISTSKGENRYTRAKWYICILGPLYPKMEIFLVRILCG